MKRLVALIAAIIILYSIYHDISHGTLTLPTIKSKSEQTAVTTTATPASTQLPFFEKKVVSGDTVLTIIEEELDASIPVPISEIEKDFKLLNNGISPQNIQAGKVYKFPDYSAE